MREVFVICNQKFDLYKYVLEKNDGRFRNICFRGGQMILHLVQDNTKEFSDSELLNLTHHLDYSQYFLRIEIDKSVIPDFEPHELLSIKIKNPKFYSIAFIGDDAARVFITFFLDRDDLYISNDCDEFLHSGQEKILTGKQFSNMIKKYPQWEHIDTEFPGEIEDIS